MQREPVLAPFLCLCIQVAEDAFSEAQRRPLSLRSPAPGSIEILDPRMRSGGNASSAATPRRQPPGFGGTSPQAAECPGDAGVIWSARVWDRTWVRLAADGSRARGPRLKMQLVDASHPEAQRERLNQLDVASGQAAPPSRGSGALGGGWEASLDGGSGALGLSRGQQCPPPFSPRPAAATKTASVASKHQLRTTVVPSDRTSTADGSAEDGQEEAYASFSPPPVHDGVPVVTRLWLGSGSSACVPLENTADASSDRQMQRLLRAIEAKLAENASLLDQG